MDKALFEEIYQTYLRVYRGQIIRRQAAEHLVSVYGGYKPNTYLRYLDSFLHMMDGTQFASVVSKDLTLFLLQRIDQDFGEEALQRALIAEKQHIQYYYNVEGVRQSGLCTALEMFAIQHNFTMNFRPQ